jgi:hypothetical protein
MSSSILLALLINMCIAGIAVSSVNYEKSTSYTPTQAVTRIRVDPSNGTANVGEEYTVSIRVESVTNLKGFSLDFRWGPAVLKYISHVTTVPISAYPNGILYPPELELADSVDEAAGLLKLSYTTLSLDTFNGSGTIFNMTFQVIRNGECNLYLNATKLADPSAQDIAHEVENGYFYKAGLDQVPVGDFYISPSPAVVNRTTTFNASASYDQDPTGTISLYIWNFGDGTIENTSDPVVTHNYTETGAYVAELSVLDNQGEGSQSIFTQEMIQVVEPNPMAKFTYWPGEESGTPPGPAVLDKEVAFDASASYDPDPGGEVVKYTWYFDDGNKTETASPTITHRYSSLPIEGSPYYAVSLQVEDTEGLLSQNTTHNVYIVEIRDIELMGISVSSSEVTQGEDEVVTVTVANKGHADENFDITGYYNLTATEWISFATTTETNLLGQNKTMQGETTPIDWGLSKEVSLENAANYIIRKLVTGTVFPNQDTRVRVGTSIGKWTIDPGKLNSLNGSSTLVPGTPLDTGGWIVRKFDESKNINGEFSAGQWRFDVRLLATENNVINATVWVRILKSSHPDPQADGAQITVIKDWTSIFPAILLRNVADTYSGYVDVPSVTFSNEYLYVEYQLEVTQNSAIDPETNVVLVLGGATNIRSRIWPTTFTAQKQYNLLWNTGNAPPGSYVVLVNASWIPHEASTTNNNATSDSVKIEVELVPLDVTVDVGTIHFRGEIAEYYILVSRAGRRVNATLQASLFFGGIQLASFAPEDFIPVTQGVYLVGYSIPADATPGVYTLVVDADHLVAGTAVSLAGTNLKSFLISQTLQGWNATLTKLDGEIATITTSIGKINANLTEIHARLTEVHGTVATISSTMGTFETELTTISAEIVGISGDTAEIRTTLGNVSTRLGDIQTATTIGTAAAAVLAAIAAIAAIFALLRKK